uniref:Uncharacterized protein n=1 Tax=Anguilla anguilla TaxID=7936 RepID=A0A0E9QCF2_ANGAN
MDAIFHLKHRINEAMPFSTQTNSLAQKYTGLLYSATPK